jgi:WD40 repeat protein
VRYQERITAASFSPDGHRVLTASDKTVQVSDAATGNPIGAPLTHQSPVTSATFSPDGRRVVTVAAGTAQLWDAESGQPVGVSFGDRVAHVAFSPDGRRLLTTSFDTTAPTRIWPLVVSCCATQEDANRLATLAEALGGTDVSATGAVHEIDGLERWQSAVRDVPAQTDSPDPLSVPSLIRRFAPATK